LEALGLSEDTIIVFWSDNGGNMYNEVEGTTPTNNAPLKDGKGNIHEGGIRVPAVIRWPGVTEAGRVSDAVVSTIDIFPTLLEMTGIEAPANTSFDGMGLEAHLRGGELDRDTMFFHFPHYVPKPRNMSASAVRHGDYKLIRRYDRDGSDPYIFELYNLADDLGETNNLAAQMPELVSELDGMIAGHLMDTNTPVPPPNPNFQPGVFNPITGKGTPPKPQPAGAKSVAGWNASGTTAGVKRDGGHLVVNSTGKDPFIATQAVPKLVGPVIGRARIKLSTSGDGQMFWASKSKPGFAGKFVDFNLIHDGQWHEYEVTLPVVGELSGFRLDPGRGEGEIRIDWIELVSPDGTRLKRWDF
ncbi:MAG: sulfatase/phosphatase domain-containing protein, partial [Planctomycetota bacterium]